jgi:ectoine hydroxylase-related dioxygenase (phytanoyl-CoA dioxygenase family)
MNTTTMLSAEQRQKFEDDGYLVLEDIGVPENVLDQIVDDLDGTYRDDVTLYTDEHGVIFAIGRIHQAFLVNDNIRGLARNPVALAALQELFGRKPLPFQTLNFDRGTQQAAHSDTIHFNSDPPGYMAGVWVALEDIDMDNGPLVYYPGSHKLPELRMKDLGLPPGGEHYPEYEKLLTEYVEDQGLEPAYGTIAKGQALIWHANLLHGGAPQNDMERTRHSQVTHYFFEGCRYWTPLLSDDEHTKWRDPKWIE